MKGIMECSSWKRTASRHFISAQALMAAFAIFICAVAASAQTNISVTTNAQGTSGYNSLSAGAGPFPFSNFGVQANSTISFGSVSLFPVPKITPGTSLTLNGSTLFQLPTFTPGSHINTNTTVTFGYSPLWTSGVVTANANVSASAGFQYNIGPFGGSKNIYNQSLSATANANLLSGGSLTSGTATASATGQNYSVGYSLSAFAASASANLVTGANLQMSVNSSSPNVQYGYYTWVNSDGTLSSGDTLTWNGVNSGPLSFTFPSPGAPNSTPFYLNFMPGVQFDMTVSPSATFSVPVSGNLSAEAFGDTLASYTFPIGTPFTENDNANPVDYSFSWAAAQYESIPLVFNYCDTPKLGCDYFDVQGNPLLFANTFLPDSPPLNFTGGGTFGGWNPSLGFNPTLPFACDPATGQCFLSNDTNMPIGPGSVSFNVTPLNPTPTPESSTLLLLGTGLIGLGAAFRRGARSRALPDTAAQR